MGKKLRPEYPFDHDDMKTSREKMNQFWISKLDSPVGWWYKQFDTVLGLTGEKTSKRGSIDNDYGISGLGGACGNGKRYEFCRFVQQLLHFKIFEYMV